MRTLIVVPTYNEIDNLQSIVQAILAKTPAEAHILIVDDASPDGTGQLADTLVKEQERVHVLHREGKKGLGTAYVAGFKWGFKNKYEAFVQMDADFSHNPDYLPTMLKLLGEHEAVIGSRYVDGGGVVNWGLGRKILSRGGSFYARNILGVSIRDLTGGFNGWRKHVLEEIDLDSVSSDGYSFQIELKYRSTVRGYQPKEFPIIFEDRKVGTSKMSRKIVIEALLRVWEFKWAAKKKIADAEPSVQA